MPAPLPDQVPVSTPAAKSSDARGKGIATDLPALTEAPKTTTVEASQQESKDFSDAGPVKGLLWSS